MLILQRRPGERVVIGTGPGAVILTVLGIDRGKRARIAVEAPAGVPVLGVEPPGRGSPPGPKPDPDVDGPAFLAR